MKKLILVILTLLSLTSCVTSGISVGSNGKIHGNIGVSTGGLINTRIGIGTDGKIHGGVGIGF